MGKVTKLLARNQVRHLERPERQKPTERDLARNAMREFLRERDEDDVPNWETDEQLESEFF